MQGNTGQFAFATSLLNVVFFLLHSQSYIGEEGGGGKQRIHKMDTNGLCKRKEKV